ncbi:MAG: class I SAM-dependent methyltransferase [Vicinamibacteria bacterium]
MNPTLHALFETQRAFDGVAETYGAANDRNPLLLEMRRQTMKALTDRVPAGSALLDLGCGPAPDARYLARLGYRVLATDWSSEMASEAQRSVRAAGLESLVEVRQLGIQEIDRLDARAFDAAYSDLGPLNCVPDLASTAAAIRERLKPGGILVASVIGRVCPWEIALYGARRDWKRLRVRFCPDFVPVPFYGRTVWTRYYRPSEFERTFAGAGFERLSLRSLGLLLPPPYLEGFAARHPRWIDALAAIEDRVAAYPLLRQWGDHFLIVMRRS